MGKLLHENLVDSANKWSDSIAFKFNDRFLTYRQLDEKANGVASFLFKKSVGKNSRVAIFMNRSLETAVAVYGILKSGAAYVPIDPTAPLNRIVSILCSCEIGYVITEPSCASNVYAICEAYPALRGVIGCGYSNHTQTEVAFTEWSEIDDISSKEFSSPKIHADDVAYIMFTSGSTGTPKGIVHSHSSGQAYARMTQSLFEITHLDRIANHAPLHFDICTLGYFTAPRAGATTVIIPEPHTRMPASMAKLVSEEEITIWYSVPFALIQLLVRGALEKFNFESLRMVQYGGEPFSPRQVRALMEIWPKAAFYNIYGPAETNQCMWYQVPADDTGEDAATPIGHVMSETCVRIVDEAGSLVELNEIGELQVHSTSMMQGYWNNDELNDNSFVLDEKRWYLTGDLVSLDSEGLYHYHGRKDRRVKIRGNRIELDEVESAACAFKYVEEAAAYVLQASSEKEHIELAVLANTKVEVKFDEELRMFLKEMLPKFAVPDSIRICEKFIRTTSGKIDRNRMRAARDSELSNIESTKSLTSSGSL